MRIERLEGAKHGASRRMGYCMRDGSINEVLGVSMAYFSDTFWCI